MNNRELQEILKKHEEWLVDKECGQKADLSGADLSGANLKRANLSGIDNDVILKALGVVYE